jgi:hypothetical protein
MSKLEELRLLKGIGKHMILTQLTASITTMIKKLLSTTRESNMIKSMVMTKLKSCLLPSKKKV